MALTTSSYISTRGASSAVDFAGALLAGVAPDGGLYVPAAWPRLSEQASLPEGPAAVAAAVLAPFLGDVLPPEALTRATARLTDGFSHPEATPLVEIAPDLFVLELFHGPTAAFKDYAMQMVAVLAEAALAALALPAIARLPRVAVPAGDRPASLAATIRRGLRHLARTPVLRGVTVATAVSMGGSGLLTLALPFWAEGLGAGRAGAGYLLAALEAGAIAGALAAARPTAGWPPHRVVLTGLGLFGLVMLAWPLARSFPAALALVALAGLAEGPAFAATFATRQRWSPSTLRGQIFTTAASLKLGAFAVGSALAGPVLSWADVAGTLVLVAGTQLLAVVLGFATGARGSSQGPAVAA